MRHEQGYWKRWLAAPAEEVEAMSVHLNTTKNETYDYWDVGVGTNPHGPGEETKRLRRSLRADLFSKEDALALEAELTDKLKGQSPTSVDSGPKRTTYLADGVALAPAPGVVQESGKPSDGEHFLIERYLLREREVGFRPGVDEVKTRKCGRRELFGVASDIRFAGTDARIFIPKGHRLHPDHLMHAQLHDGVEVVEIVGFDYDAEMAAWRLEDA